MLVFTVNITQHFCNLEMCLLQEKLQLTQEEFLLQVIEWSVCHLLMMAAYVPCYNEVNGVIWLPDCYICLLHERRCKIYSCDFDRWGLCCSSGFWEEFRDLPSGQIWVGPRHPRRVLGSHMSWVLHSTGGVQAIQWATLVGMSFSFCLRIF